MIGKQALDVQQRVHRDAVEVAHDNRRGRRLGFFTGVGAFKSG